LGSIPGRGTVFFHSVQNGSGIHSASIPIGTGVPSPEVMRQGSGTDHLSPSSAEIKNGGAIPPLPTETTTLKLVTEYPSESFVTTDDIA
jgi:hypothetical protein